MPIAVPTSAIVRSAGLSGFMPAATMSDNSETSREAASVRSTTPLLTPLVSPVSLMSAPQSLALRIGQERRKAPARLLPLLHLAHAGATRGVVARARHGRRLLHLRQRRGRGRVLAHDVDRPAGTAAFAIMAESQAAKRRRPCVPGHHHRVAAIGRTAKTLDHILLGLDLDASRSRLELGRDKIGEKPLIVGKRDRRSAFLIRVESLAELPDRV